MMGNKVKLPWVKDNLKQMSYVSADFKKLMILGYKVNGKQFQRYYNIHNFFALCSVNHFFFFPDKYWAWKDWFEHN